jgi:hypothetical protein
MAGVFLHVLIWCNRLIIELSTQNNIVSAEAKDKIMADIYILVENIDT